MFEKFTPENPFIIAEIGVNYEGDLTKAHEMIREISQAGGHCAKFQLYKAETIAAKDSPAYWDQSAEPTKTQFELFQKHDKFGYSDYEQLASTCSNYNVDFLATPFDLQAVEKIDELSSYFKIASADITNYPLIRQVASKSKPVLLSTGASTLKEISDAVKQLEKFGASEICLLHCVLNYPTPYENANLQYIKTLRKEFSSFSIGYSDHVKPDPSFSPLLVALEYGASIIEKHYTYDKNISGNDHYHSFDKEDLASFTSLISSRNRLRGNKDKNLANEQTAIRNARRSLHVNKFLECGHKITADDIICLRPGIGISPSMVDDVVGKHLTTSLTEGQRIKLSDLKIQN